MNNRRKEFWIKHTMRIIAAVMYIIAAILFCGALSGCRTHQQVCGITEDLYIHDTIRLYNLRVDSLIRHDSIYLREYVKGDTVIIEKARWHYLYKDRLRVDTAYVERTRTEVLERAVARSLTRWEKIRMGLGDTMLTGLLLLLLYAIYQLWRNFRTLRNRIGF